MTAVHAPISPGTTGHGLVPADDLVRRLGNARLGAAPGTLISAFQIVISFGLLPLILWPMRWAAYLDAERTDVLELIDRWRSRVAPSDAKQLDIISRRFRPRPMLMVLPWLVAGFTGVLMIALLSQGNTLHDIAALTYHQPMRLHPFEHHWEWHGEPIASRDFYPTGIAPLRDARFELRSHLFEVWLWGLLFGYCCHWYAVRTHARSMDSLVNWSNRLATANGLPPVQAEPLRTGMGPMWIVLAVVLCVFNAWWGIPLVLGGAMQRRYSRLSSVRIRSALGAQLRDGLVFAAREPASARFCGSPQCGAKLPAAANFCPRCGSAAVSS